jgi:hypothetical protein
LLSGTSAGLKTFDPLAMVVSSQTLDKTAGTTYREQKCVSLPTREVAMASLIPVTGERKF